MSLPTADLTTLTTRVLAYFRTAFPGYPLDAKKFLGRLSNASAKTLWTLHNALEQVEVDIVPSSQSSADILSAWAELLGLPDGAGGYGRILPTVASGGVATLTGTKGTVYPAGAVATAEDGSTQISLDVSVTISGSPPGLGSIAGNFTAITAGTVGNLPVGSVLTWQTPPSGADASFTLTSPLGAGTDSESNAQVYSRIVARLQNPPRGGVAEDYYLWSKTVAGTGPVFVYPKRSGTGTVDVVVTTGGSGQGRLPSAALLTAVQTALDSARPVGAEAVSALAPSMPNGSGRLIKIRVIPNQNQEFDWIDTVGGPFTVSVYSAGPPATIKLNTLAPASLKAAITAFIAGTDTAPRLQVVSTGAVINPSVSCTNFSDGGGQTTLTLASVPAGWVVPTAGDVVYAFGPATTPIASAVLGLIDSLGPSRVSGFADNFQPWQDTLSIAGIINIAEDVIATDGNFLISEVPVNGVTINGVVADVTGVDTTTPELLYALHIIVTQ